MPAGPAAADSPARPAPGVEEGLVPKEVVAAAADDLRHPQTRRRDQPKLSWQGQKKTRARTINGVPFLLKLTLEGLIYYFKNEDEVNSRD